MLAQPSADFVEARCVRFDDRYKRSLRRIKKTRRKYCKVCGVWLTSRFALREHEEGKKHRRNLDGNSKRTCRHCKTTLNTEKDYKEHLNGRRHCHKINYLSRKAPEAEIKESKHKVHPLNWLYQKRREF